MTTTDAIVFLSLLTLFTVAFLGWGFMQLLSEDRHRRERVADREAAAAERQVLLQRIQDPQQASIEHTVAVMPAAPEPDVDEDLDTWMRGVTLNGHDG